MSTQNIKIGVIGGSGLYQMEGLKQLDELHINTPFGAPSDALIVGEVEHTPIAFLPRHGRGHVHMPTEVPYRANIFALKALGVQYVISVSACGSLRESLHPGEIVIPDQLFDFTKNRKSSFFGKGWVAHISTANPYCPTLSELLTTAMQEAGGTVHQGGTFITIEGPRFSTRGESEVFRAWGMDIIGMTACPEAFLAREAGMCYATMAHITDYDVWHESEETVTVNMVIEQLNKNVGLAQQAIRLLTPRLASHSRTCECAHALDTALITAPDFISPETREKLKPLLP